MWAPARNLITEGHLPFLQGYTESQTKAKALPVLEAQPPWLVKETHKLSTLPRCSEGGSQGTGKCQGTSTQMQGAK